VRILAILALLVVPLAPAAAQQTTSGGEILGRVFSEIERQVIEDYYRSRHGGEVYEDDDQDEDWDDDRGERKHKKHKKHGKRGGDGLPPGLAKRDRLPPGLEKQLVERGRLPPGLEKRTLPDDLRSRLGSFDDGTEPQIVGDDVLLVDVATGVILDILRGVAAGN